MPVLIPNPQLVEAAGGVLSSKFLFLVTQSDGTTKWQNATKFPDWKRQYAFLCSVGRDEEAADSPYRIYTGRVEANGRLLYKFVCRLCGKHCGRDIFRHYRTVHVGYRKRCFFCCKAFSEGSIHKHENYSCKIRIPDNLKWRYWKKINVGANGESEYIHLPFYTENEPDTDSVFVDGGLVWAPEKRPTRRAVRQINQKSKLKVTSADVQEEGESVVNNQDELVIKSAAADDIDQSTPLMQRHGMEGSLIVGMPHSDDNDAIAD